MDDMYNTIVLEESLLAVDRKEKNNPLVARGTSVVQNRSERSRKTKSQTAVSQISQRSDLCHLTHD